MRAIDVRYNKLIIGKSYSHWQGIDFSNDSDEEIKKMMSGSGCPEALNEKFENDCGISCWKCWCQEVEE
jgi:hypothetical protein